MLGEKTVALQKDLEGYTVLFRYLPFAMDVLQLHYTEIIPVLPWDVS